MNADRSCTCFALTSPERTGGAVAPRGRAARTCARARAESCRHAASLRSSAVATSLKEKSNTSCSRKAARSSGDNRSSVKSSAKDRSSASSVQLSGASAAVSTTGSGSRGPTYSSCRARAEVRMLRQIRVVVVMRNALGSDTLSRSAPCQRKYVSCTASSASVIDPSMRYARPSRRRRYGSKLSAGFDILPRISRRAHRRIRRRRFPAMIEHHRRAADNDAHTGLAVAKRVLDRWIDSRRGDRKSQADQGSAPPALYDLLAKLVGRGIVCERGTREFPCQGYVRRHRVGAVREHGAENRRTDTVTLRHCDGKLRARTAVLVAYGGNACGTPGVDGKVTPEPSEGVDPGKEPRGTRARVDHVADVTGVVVPVPLELVNQSAQCPSDHARLLSSAVRPDGASKCDACNATSVHGSRWHASLPQNSPGIILQWTRWRYST